MTTPGVHAPHWVAPEAERLDPRGIDGLDRADFAALHLEGGHETRIAGRPSIHTVHAPHSPSPHPSFVPVSPSP